MKVTSYLAGLLARAFVDCLIGLLVVTAAGAQPITYTGFAISDGQLGAWQFHNARVILTFQTDTRYVQELSIPVPGHTAPKVAVNTIGMARIKIIDHEKTVEATFDPNQIFISYDQFNGGVGFGSMVPGVPFPDSIISPVYPLAISDGVLGEAQGGTNCSGNGVQFSAEGCALPIDLKGNGAFVGIAWSCFGIPRSNDGCSEADVTQQIGRLTTDRGDLYLFQSYASSDITRDTFNVGFFFQEMGDSHEDGHSQFPLPSSLSAPSSPTASDPIVYNAFLISDVSIGGELIHTAGVHLYFRSTISSVKPLPGGGLNGYINEDGIAKVTMTKDGHTITATFAPHQLYVFFNPSNASVGFGSYSGGVSYPIYLSANTPGAPSPILGADLTGAVSDIIANPVDSFLYTPGVAALAQVTDLRHETLLASYVSSCTAFSPNGDYFFFTPPCIDLSASPRLSTDRGDFYLYEPYYISAPLPATFNMAVFWTSFALHENE